jgi:hypothetical protein
LVLPQLEQRTGIVRRFAVCVEAIAPITVNFRFDR